MDDRRVADEQFRRELAERMKAIEIGQQELKEDNKEIKQEIIKQKMAQLDLHYTLFGGPKSDDVGLLEKFRKLLYRFAGALTVAFGILAFAAKLISPLYNKIVSEYLFNSVSERWMREQSRPHIKHYTIIQKNDKPEE